MIKIFIVSDIKIYGQGLLQMLSRVHSFICLGTESDCKTAIDKIDHMAPDLVLLDMTMAGSNSCISHIQCSTPRTKIIALAMTEEINRAIQSGKEGIAACISREASLQELVGIILKLARQEGYDAHSLIKTGFNKVQDIVADYASHELFSILTKREHQIMDLLDEGLSNKQIAATLNIELPTVKNHVCHIYSKLDVNSRTQAVSLLHRVRSGYDCLMSTNNKVFYDRYIS